MMPKAKKSLGQNWLVDEGVIEKIVDAAGIKPGETVLEIGPGTGVLTQALVNAGATVTAIEFDHTLIENLQKRFGTDITLIQGNVLEMNLESLGSSYKVVANIPYNITSDILRFFLTHQYKPSRMVLMVQWEVAKRITASPPDMSLLSVMCQLYARCKRVVKVPAGAFRPIPKVDSGVVQLDLHDLQKKGDIDPESVLRVAKVGFSSRRKQLKNTLVALGRSSEDLQTVFKKLGVDSSARPQTLQIEAWVKLTHMLNNFEKNT